MDRQTSVAVVQTRPETVLADYARLLRLAGIVGVTERGAATEPARQAWELIPTPPRRRPGPATACPPWQLEGVVRALLEAGSAAEDIALVAPPGARADRPPLAEWRRVLAACGLDEVRAAPGGAPAGGDRLALANLRTHRRLGLAGGVMALVESLAGEREPVEWLRRPRELAAAWQAVSDRVAGAVMDATIAGDGLHGAVTVPVAAHLLLAGRDPVAVDAVACRLAGLPARRVPLLAELAHAGLGTVDPPSIELIGDVAASTASLELVAARSFRTGRGTGGPRWWRRLSARLDDHWPRPLQRRRAQRRYEAQAWGKLHADYRRRGFIGGGDQ